jgi:uncharacterized membrane protein YoaK (UPF0700 family)
MPAEGQAVPKPVPVLLSLLAGYVDSCTFLALFGLFVAQVTGSFVFAGTQLVAHEPGGLIKLLAIPTFFVACVVTTVLVKRRQQRGGSPLAATLALEALLLAGLYASLLFGAPLRGPDAPIAICAALCGLCAMGVQSALVRLLIRGGPSTNVMTTNSTLFAIDATELVMAARARRLAPDDAALATAHAEARERFHTLWPIVLGFLAGTISGALAFAWLDRSSILAAVALAGGLAAWAGRGVGSKRLP